MDSRPEWRKRRYLQFHRLEFGQPVQATYWARHHIRHANRAQQDVAICSRIAAQLFKQLLQNRIDRFSEDVEMSGSAMDVDRRFCHLDGEYGVEMQVGVSIISNWLLTFPYVSLGGTSVGQEAEPRVAR